MPSFRDTAYDLSPSRLRTSQMSRLVYATLGLPLDALADMATQATMSRFPDVCPEDALPHHGRDRRILRGPGETTDGYRARLVGWLDAWAIAGCGSSMLDQLAAYVTPHPMRMRIVTQGGVWYTREVDGTTDITHRDPALWDWDGDAPRWARMWVILYPPPGLWSPGPKWGDASLWGGSWGSPGYTWGTTATPEGVASVRAIGKQWKPAFARIEKFIIAFDPSSFAPDSTDLPDGKWGNHSKDDGTGTWVASRVKTACYWDGV